MSNTPPPEPEENEGVPSYMVRGIAQKLAEHLRRLHQSIESTNQKEIQDAIIAVNASIGEMRSLLRIISGEVKRIEKAQPAKPTDSEPSDKPTM